MRTWSTLLFALYGCSGNDKAQDTETGAPHEDSGDPAVDEDGDGYAAGDDCDDADASVHPDAVELCDGVDNDCDAQIDEDVETVAYYVDADGDGFGALATDPVRSCESPGPGYATVEGDCDDTDPEVYPDATEICDDADNDCDGAVDEDAEPTAWYTDADGDGFGADGADGALFCGDPGAGYAAVQGDCDDGSADVNPEAEERCDGVDDDCDGLTDAADADLTDGVTLYEDRDSDGYGDPSDTWIGCSGDTGGVEVGEDCDDLDPDFHPGAAEDDCTDPNDYNCDGSVAYTDADGDGYAACVECDDADGDVSPEGVEACDGIDNDCDGDIDEAGARGELTWYTDGDGDGFGDPDAGGEGCTAPAGAVSDATDCDDGAGEVHPGASEICDGIDNDCDAATDDADASVDLSTGLDWTYDYDRDGYGGDTDTVTACEAPTSRYVAEGGDCDDEDAAYHPDATEGCDGDDYNCDGEVDNDDDGDGFADMSCGGLDCNDADPDLYPTPTGACAMGESCAQILESFPDSASGTYTIDPDGYGAGADPYDVACDMETSGGGWTQVLYWDAETDGDGTAEIEALMVEEYNNMSIWGDKSGYIRWADNNASADVMSYRYDITVPNSGDALFNLHLYAYSMDDSATFFYVSSGGEPSNLACHDNYTSSSHVSKYSSTEQSYFPTYTCDFVDRSATFTWDEEEIVSASDEIDAFYLRAFMYDTYGDYAYLYHMDLWVR